MVERRHREALPKWTEQIIFRTDRDWPIDAASGERVEYQVRKYPDGRTQVRIGDRDYETVIAEIGGAPLLPALDLARLPGVGVVVIDPRADRISQDILEILHRGDYQQVPRFLNQMGYYDHLPQDIETRIAQLYEDIWIAGTKQTEDLYLVSGKAGDVDLWSVDCVACYFPNPTLMPPEEIIDAGRQMMRPGGSLEIVTENEDWWNMLLQGFDDQMCLEGEFGTIYPSDRAEPRSVFEVIIAGRKLYRAVVPMNGGNLDSDRVRATM